METGVGKGSSFQVTIDLERVPSPQDLHLPPWRVLVVDHSAKLRETAEYALRELGV